MQHQPRRFVAALLALVMAMAVIAQDMHYGYDELGRLIEAVDGDGGRTRYKYDAAGNLLVVTVEQGVEPPVVDDSSVERLRCGSPVTIAIAGRGLEGARVETDDPLIEISDLRYTDTGLTFSLRVDCAAPQDAHRLALTTASGTTWLDIVIDPVLPELRLIPTPLAIPPDGSDRLFLVRLSSVDNREHQVDLSLSNTAMAELAPDSLVFAPGEVEKSATIRGLSVGHTVLTLTSDTLAPLQVPVFVTADFVGINTSFGNQVGVVRTVEPKPVEIDVPTLASAPVGVALGSYLEAVEPRRLAVGSDDARVVVRGSGLDTSAAVTIVPQQGLTWSGPEAGSDGNAIRLSISVGEDAATGLRQIRFPGVAPLSPDADRLLITGLPPELDSIDPLFVRPGDTGVTLTLRGRHLQDIEALTITPADGLVLGAEPVVNGAGTVVTVNLTVSPDAPLGPRVVTLWTPAGTTADEPVPANTMTVVAEIDGQVPSVLGSQVGVMRASAPVTPEYSAQSLSAAVGIQRGPVLEALVPRVAEPGQALTLSLQGNSLQGVDRIEFYPADGIHSQGEPRILDQGETVELDIAVAAGASLSPRLVQVWAGDKRVPASRPEAAQLRIISGLPRIDSVSPLHWPTGSPALALQVRGEHLGDSPVLGLVPADGVYISPAQVNSAGTLVTAEAAIAGDAAPGPRLLQVLTEGGASSDQLGPANTVHVVDETPTLVPSVVATQVGIHRDSEAPEVAREFTHYSQGVGLIRRFTPPPPETDIPLVSRQLGLLRGPGATSLSPAGVLAGGEYSLQVTGVGLDTVDGARLMPGTGTEITAFGVDDGHTLTLDLRVAVDAPLATHSLQLTAQGQPVPFVRAAAGQLWVGEGAPEIDSIEPILAGLGDVVELLVRGRNLHGATAVFSEPAAGLQFAPMPQVNSAGTELRIGLAVAPDAPLGDRVIRVRLPGAVSGAAPEPANTLTIFESVP